MIQKLLRREFIRFGLNGLLGYLAYLAITSVLIVGLGLSYILGVTIGFAVQAGVSAWLHSTKTFVGDEVATNRQQFLYLAWFVLCYVIELALIALMVESLAWLEMLAVFIASLLIFLPSYYVTGLIYRETPK